MAGDEVLLDDAFKHGRVTVAIPGPFGVDDGNRAVGTDTQAVGLGAVDAALLAESQFLETALEVIPSIQSPLLFAAVGFGLVAAEEDMTTGLWYAHGLKNAVHHGVRGVGLQVVSHGS